MSLLVCAHIDFTIPRATCRDHPKKHYSGGVNAKKTWHAKGFLPLIIFCCISHAIQFHN